MRRRRLHIRALLLSAVLVAVAGVLRAEEQPPSNPQPAPMSAETEAVTFDPAVWTLHAFVVDRADGWPLRGATVRAWLVRPGVRTLLATGTTYDGGRAILDVSRLEGLSPVLRARSRVEVEAALDGWHIDQDSPYVLPGHPPWLRLPAWPIAGERQLRAVCQVSDRGGVTGRILDAQGQPVLDAGVRIGPSGPETSTRSDGRFRIPVPADGAAHIYIAHGRLGTWSSDELQLERPRDTPLGDITLQPKASHFGRIVDSTGDPVADLPLVFAHDAASGPPGPALHRPYQEQAATTRAMTNADGTFSMTLRTGAERAPVLECSPHAISSPPLRIPFATQAKEGTQGEPWVLGHHRVRGRVLLPGGTPLPEIKVHVTIEAPNGARHSIQTDAEGRFEVLLGAGRSARLRAHTAHTEAREVHVSAPRTPGTQDLRLVLHPHGRGHGYPRGRGYGLQVSTRGPQGAPPGQLTCIVWNEQYEEILQRRVLGVGAMQLVLPAGRYWLKLSSEDRRAFDPGGPPWQRYRPIYALVHMRPFRESRLRHRFEELAYLRILPHKDNSDLPSRAPHVLVKAVRVAGEATTREWESKWPSESARGLPAEALDPGTYDIHVRTAGYRPHVKRVTLIPGRVVDAHVRLVGAR